MLLDVVGKGAGALGIEFAGSVPRASRGVDRRRIALKAARIEILHQIAAEHTPIGHKIIIPLVAAPARKPVNENVGILGVELRVVNLNVRNVERREAEHNYGYDK